MDGASNIQDGQLALFMVGEDTVTRVSSTAIPMRARRLGLWSELLGRCAMRSGQELERIVAAGRAKEVVDLNLSGNRLK